MMSGDTTSLKLLFNGEYRRIPVGNGPIRLSLEKLQEKTISVFPNLKGSNCVFSWIDEENDFITLSTDEELQDAIRHFQSLGKTVLKFEVKIASTLSPQASQVPQAPQTAPSEEPSGQVVHSNITCDECGTFPITGIRFKCSVREDFDLCERCESKGTQPFPMIKIYHPNQTPLAIMIAVRDDPRGPHPYHHHNHRGRHGPRFPHHPPFDGPWHGPRPHFEGSCTKDSDIPTSLKKYQLMHQRGVPAHAVISQMNIDHISEADQQLVIKTFDQECGRGPHNKFGRWARCAARTFTEAVDNFVNSASSTTSTETNLPQSAVSENDEIEQKLVEEAVRMSVEEATPQVDLSMSSKPRARFVKDITYPDGTVVQPGTNFVKVWRIRNDGSADWPNGFFLVSAGGDELSPNDVKVPLPPIKAGQEADIEVSLQAPCRSGRYVAYYRLQTDEGSNFGHRLWTDIRVADDEDGNMGWQVISGVLGRAADEAQSTEPNVEATAVPDEQVSLSTAPATFIEVDDSQISIADSIPASTSTSASTSDMALDIWARVYETELRVLRDMGFSDLATIIPLLREHVGVPVSRNPESGGLPSAEGMQRVVIRLLGQSMTA